MNIEITVVYHSKTCTSYNVFHTIIIIPDEHGKLKKKLKKTIDKGKIRRKKKRKGNINGPSNQTYWF